MRGSRTVLREAAGEVPAVYSPIESRFLGKARLKSSIMAISVQKTGLKQRKDASADPFFDLALNLYAEVWQFWRYFEVPNSD